MPGATKAMQSVGATIFIAAALPATYDQAGYAALAWKEIGEVDNIPEYGGEADTVTRTPLKTGVTDKQKGSTNFGSFTLDGGYAPADVGQAQLILSAAPTAGPVSIKVQLADGTLDNFTALIMGYKKTVGASGDFVKFASKVEVKSTITTVLPA